MLVIINLMLLCLAFSGLAQAMDGRCVSTYHPNTASCLVKDAGRALPRFEPLARTHTSASPAPLDDVEYQ